MWFSSDCELPQSAFVLHSTWICLCNGKLLEALYVIVSGWSATRTKFGSIPMLQ